MIVKLLAYSAFGNFEEGQEVTTLSMAAEEALSARVDDTLRLNAETAYSLCAVERGLTAATDRLTNAEPLHVNSAALLWYVEPVESVSSGESADEDDGTTYEEDDNYITEIRVRHVPYDDDNDDGKNEASYYVHAPVDYINGIYGYKALSFHFESDTNTGKQETQYYPIKDLVSVKRMQFDKATMKKVLKDFEVTDPRTGDTFPLSYVIFLE